MMATFAAVVVLVCSSVIVVTAAALLGWWSRGTERKRVVIAVALWLAVNALGIALEGLLLMILGTGLDNLGWRDRGAPASWWLTTAVVVGTHSLANAWVLRFSTGRSQSARM